MDTPEQRLLIGVVGVCGSGKSTLTTALRAYHIQARHIAQEHSYVPTMWQHITHPDLLIYLDASYPVTIRRRKLNWTIGEYQEQIKRLEHARQHADLLVFTDGMAEEEVLAKVLDFLESRGIPATRVE